MSLDGLRGAAALAVVAEHSFLTSPVFWAAFNDNALSFFKYPIAVSLLTFTPLHLFWSGGAAVKIFFVLSGLVLSLPYWAGESTDYGRYIGKRLARLLPVYIFSLAFTFVAFRLANVHAITGGSFWLNRYWHSSPEWGDLARALLFLPSWFIATNAPLWTLVHEFRISLVLPVLLVTLRARPAVALLVCVACGAAAKVLENNALFSGADAQSFLETAAQLWLFALGALIARYVEAIRAAARSLHPAMQILGLLLGVGLLLLKWIVPVPTVLTYFLSGIGAAIAICGALAVFRFGDLLSRPPVLFLGRISYSLYAVHFPVLIFALLVSHVYRLDFLLSGIVIAGLFAAALNAGFERPLMRVAARALGGQSVRGQAQDREPTSGGGPH